MWCKHVHLLYSRKWRCLIEREVGQGGEVCPLAFWKRNLSAKESEQTKKKKISEQVIYKLKRRVLGKREVFREICPIYFRVTKSHRLNSIKWNYIGKRRSGDPELETELSPNLRLVGMHILSIHGLDLAELLENSEESHFRSSCMNFG